MFAAAAASLASAAAFAASNAARFFLALALSAGTLGGLGVLGGGGAEAAGLTVSEAFFLGRPLVLVLGNGKRSSGPDDSALSSTTTSGGMRFGASIVAVLPVSALVGLRPAVSTSALVGASIPAELELLLVVFELVDDEDLDPELDRERERGDLDRSLGDRD